MNFQWFYPTCCLWQKSLVYYNESSGTALAAHTTWTYVAIQLCEGYNNEYTYWRDVALETCTFTTLPRCRSSNYSSRPFIKCLHLHFLPVSPHKVGCLPAIRRPKHVPALPTNSSTMWNQPSNWLCRRMFQQPDHSFYGNKVDANYTVNHLRLHQETAESLLYKPGTCTVNHIRRSGSHSAIRTLLLLAASVRCTQLETDLFSFHLLQKIL